MIQNMLIVLMAALNDRKGVSALEYVVLAVAVVGAVTAGAATMIGPISSAFSKVVVDLG